MHVIRIRSMFCFGPIRVSIENHAEPRVFVSKMMTTIDPLSNRFHGKSTKCTKYHVCACDGRIYSGR